MRVYIESNFILELALLREEHENCSALLDLARSQRIQLILPAFAVGEPYEALVRRSKQRIELSKRLNLEIQELGRSEPYRERLKAFQELTDLLLNSNLDEKPSLDQTLETVLTVAETIPITLNVMQSSIAIQQKHNFSPQDSLVYASVLADLSEHRPETSCFVTKNNRDFSGLEVRQSLSDYDCQILWRFEDCLGYIRHQIAAVSN